ncbi:ABC transporter permease subunit [Streptomyces phaeochromogenes]|uniref:ABC transporter permease subunit n=1 Tax=Streptomyces phaeochromogenes TaxID=1923 RepID=UPI0033D4DAF7
MPLWFAHESSGAQFDRLARGSAFLGLATPVFVFGLCLIPAASYVVPTWPAVGFVPLSDDPVRNLQSIVLPALALGLPLGSTLCRFMRASMIEVYEQDYMRTALATGTTRWQATLRHGLRNASGPGVTVAGLQLAGCDGDPVADIDVLADPANVVLVMQEGRLAKHTLPETAG